LSNFHLMRRQLQGEVFFCHHSKFHTRKKFASLVCDQRGDHHHQDARGHWIAETLSNQPLQSPPRHLATLSVGPSLPDSPQHETRVCVSARGDQKDSIHCMLMTESCRDGGHICQARTTMQAVLRRESWTA